LEIATDAELRKLEINQQTVSPSTSFSGLSNPRSTYIPKLPPFDEGKDDIDSFLFRFESHANSCGWPKDKWTLYVASLLRGSALVLYHTLAAREGLTWDQLKEELLKKFQCTPDGFRDKFRAVRPETGESFPSFLIRSSHYLDRWIELTQTKKEYDSLRDLLLREQLLQSVSRDLAVFLREREFKTAEEMCRAADQYRNAHPEKGIARKGDSSIFEAGISSFPPRQSRNFNFQGRPGCTRYQSEIDTPRNQPTRPYSQGQNNTPSQTFMRGGQANRQTYNRGHGPSRFQFGFNRGQGRGGQPFRTTGSEISEKAEIRCYHCDGKFHVRNKCPFLFSEQSSATTNVASGVSEHKAACVLTPDQVIDGLLVEEGAINGLQASVLRDTGCTTAGVKKSFVLPEQYLGVVQKCRSFGGKVEEFPLAKISVDTPYYTGPLTACVIESPVCDLILGNLPGVATVHGGSGGSFIPCLVTTRAQTLKESKPQTPLKVPDLSVLDIEPKELAALQKEDSTLQHLYTSVVDIEPTSHNKPYYMLETNILFRFFPKGDKVTKQIVVPQGLRDTILHTAHDAIFAGHCGIKRTLQRVLNSFHWPGVTNAVVKYCHSCDICQKTVQKGRIPCAPLHKMPLITVPFQKVAIDLIGPFQPSSTGNRYVLTIVDTATRFPEAIPLRKIDTVSVAEALLTVFSRVGLPQEILSDCGTQFVSDMMKEIYRLLSISSVTTTPYHPQSNGMVERFNGTLKSMLRKVTRMEPQEWDRYIPALLFAYRELPNETLGFSPFELVFGHSPRGPLDLLAGKWTGTSCQEDASNVYQYVYELHNKIKDTCELAQEHAGENTDRYKQFADRKAKMRSLSVSDKVLVLLTDEHSKLRVLWKGPFPVIKKISAVNYEINMDGKNKVFHINMLKQYTDRVNVAINQSVENNETTDMTDTVPNISDILSPEFVPDIQYRHHQQRQEKTESASVGLLTDTVPDLSIPLPTLSVQGETFEDVVISDHLTQTQTAQLKSVLKEYQDILTDKPGTVIGVEPHTIHLNSDKPIRIKPYPLPFAKKAVVEKEIQVMLDLGVIEPSTSPYSSPVVLVGKPDGSVRFCIDYRQLNKLTVFDAEPIPDIEELLCQLSEGRYFVKIDLTKGYWQIPMREADREKTAFQTPFGLYQWTKMPFGLQNAPATFARMMRLLKLHECGAVCFFDDILLSRKTWSELLVSLRDIFTRLRAFGLKARPSKVRAGFQTLEFLGHTISVGKMMPEDAKVKKILSLQKPTNKKQVRSVLGLLSYYRRYVPHFASVTAPLTDLTKGTNSKSILWTEDCQRALVKIQKVLNTFPVLLLPSLTEDFVLQTDASSKGMGAVLLQSKDGLLHPVQFASKKFSSPQQKYSTIERECLAIIWACGKFERFLTGREFILQTDHRPLTFLQASKTKNNRLLRWALALQEFRFCVEPIPGTSNVLADILSRE
jgi:hypothetical protein